MLTPVLQDGRSTGLTYEPFYGLREKAFSLTSDSRFFYQSRSHAPAFDDLVSAIRRRESLNVLTGDIGTGKTTLCRTVLQNLDRKTFSAFVPDPFASREDLLKVLLMDFGVASTEDLTSGRLRDASRTELSYLLYEFLRTLAPLQAFAVVFLDEAQNLSVPLLEEVRILSDADGQLQVVLVGQLELREKLKLPEMRQLDQRVSVHCTLAALDCAGVAGYISHRLHTAGGSAERLTFSGDAVEAIYERSGGVARIINRLCDRALRYGYSKRAMTINAEIVDAANPDVMCRAAAPVAAAIVPAPAPVAAAASESDPLDSWLAGIDEPEDAAAAMGLAGSPEEPWQRRRVPIKPIAEPERGTRPWFRIRIGPGSHVQQAQAGLATQRWTRRLEMILLCLTLVFAALVGPSTFEMSRDLWTVATAQLAPPPAPGLPVRPAVRLAPPLELPHASDAVELDTQVPTAGNTTAARR
ncbi:MAG TPA: AAA family ATPase [Vicinamibacterales bacterium]|nr:AAA family ATPase [Vicinamibacterales bacterium]